VLAVAGVVDGAAAVADNGTAPAEDDTGPAWFHPEKAHTSSVDTATTATTASTRRRRITSWPLLSTAPR
jgi:hypothetical protein